MFDLNFIHLLTFISFLRCSSLSNFLPANRFVSWCEGLSKVVHFFNFVTVTIIGYTLQVRPARFHLGPEPSLTDNLFWELMIPCSNWPTERRLKSITLVTLANLLLCIVGKWASKSMLLPLACILLPVASVVSQFYNFYVDRIKYCSNSLWINNIVMKLSMFY